MMDSSSETRDTVLHVPNLYEYFCQRTADDMRARGGSVGEPPAVSFATLLISALMALTFFMVGKPALAKAMLAVFGILVLWTVWGVIIRSTEQISQKAENIRAGVFPPASAPFVLARLKWWNHLIAPRRWGRYSRLYDRKVKLERRIAGVAKQLQEAGGEPPSDQDVADLAEKMNSFTDRNSYEMAASGQRDPKVRLSAELTLYRALLVKLEEMAGKLDRIAKLTVVFQDVSPDDLSQVVTEALQILEERRVLVVNVDKVDPERFVDLVTVRVD